MKSRTLHFQPELRLCAAGLAGDPEALSRLASSPELETLVVANRIAPGLAIRASELGVTGAQVAVWNQHLRAAAALRLQLQATMNSLSEALAEGEIAWAPLKGMGLDPRYYKHPEERISTDLDVLISPRDLQSAVKILENHGFCSLAATDRQRRFVEDEGYNWKFSFGNSLLVELHFRLWGGVPEELAAGMLNRSQLEPRLGPTARAVGHPDAFIVAAVHVWQTPPPRYLTLWWDLLRIADALDDKSTRAVINRAIEYGLQAYVADSSEAAADLWSHPRLHLISDELKRRLRSPERWMSKIARQSIPTQAGLEIITLGRLLANRPSRSGWRAVPRRIWAHPGIVDADTPDTWSWPRRRLTHVARALRLVKH